MAALQRPTPRHVDTLLVQWPAVRNQTPAFKAPKQKPYGRDGLCTGMALRKKGIYITSWYFFQHNHTSKDQFCTLFKSINLPICRSGGGILARKNSQVSPVCKVKTFTGHGTHYLCKPEAYRALRTRAQPASFS